ncbi:ABC transporter ATP-binding protein [Gleimia hominis]|uniref:ABC transporter ATP-binding protein n=1 Tax=Gleimia hominis TaxID=595468 RepID=UPI000C7FA824|nr:ABC transporter ATP-binding protein [Gleimia hominis]WIK64918.1 ABC transporter ATP-binding protein [Gleimia hominis]
MSKTKTPSRANQAPEDVEEELDESAHGRRPDRKAQHFWASMRKLLALLAPWKWQFAVIFGASALWSAMTVIAPRVLGEVTNTLFEGVFSKHIPAGGTKAQAVQMLRDSGHEDIANMVSAMHIVPGQGIDFNRLAMLSIIVLLIYLASNLLDFYVGWNINRVVVKALYDLRRQVEEKIHALPLSYFDQMKRGDLISRVTNDVDNITNALQQTLSSVITSIFWGTGLIIMMFVTSWKLALVAMTILPMMALIVLVIGPLSQKAYGRQWAATGRLNARVEESFSAHALVHAFGRKYSQAQDFAQENDELYSASLRARFLGGMMMPLMTFAGLLAYVGIAVLGGLQVAMGQMRLGSVQAFIQYSQQFNQPIGQLSQAVTVMQSAAASAERVFEILEAEEETPASEHPAQLQPGPGHIEFRHVNFSYNPDEPLIEDMNLDAKPGQTVAIVGPTGAGKTTLVNLIMRFYEIQSGTILLDGQDTRELTRQDLRSRVGMVLQDPWLFQGTIAENNRYGRSDASDEEVLAAAKASYVDRFVASLPDGYDTVLEGNADNVSAGERQLITIARAFISDPAILILDEATSSVDTRTELLLQKAMVALRHGRTAFVIAHRLSTIRDADVIVVMEHGSIVEQGTHDELLERRGAYWRLYNSQFEEAGN